MIASLLAIATSGIGLYLNKKVKFQIIKATLLTIGLGVMFFAPIGYALNSLTSITNNFNSDIIAEVVKLKQDFALPEYLGVLKPYINNFLESISVANISSIFFKYTTLILKNSAGFVKDMIIILIFYFFINLYSKELLSFIQNILPFENNSSFFIEISSVMNIVFYSTLITAIFEGTLFAMLVIYFGYDGLLFGILYGFASLIPVIGGAIMWVPISLYQFSTGDSFGAVVIALYSILVISLIADTFIKPIIIEYVNTLTIKNPSNINPLIIFFSMIAGLTTFGFWGVIIGPAITTFFISLLKIYQTLFMENR
jgi:predicted PurR-regulated permease PerM